MIAIVVAVVPICILEPHNCDESREHGVNSWCVRLCVRCQLILISSTDWFHLSTIVFRLACRFVLVNYIRVLSCAGVQYQILAN